MNGARLFHTVLALMLPLPICARHLARLVVLEEQQIPADPVLLAMGFTGPRKAGLLEGFGVALTDRRNVALM